MSPATEFFDTQASLHNLRSFFRDGASQQRQCHKALANKIQHVTTLDYCCCFVGLSRWRPRRRRLGNGWHGVFLRRLARQPQSRLGELYGRLPCQISSTRPPDVIKPKKAELRWVDVSLSQLLALLDLLFGLFPRQNTITDVRRCSTRSFIAELHFDGSMENRRRIRMIRRNSVVLDKQLSCSTVHGQCRKYES